MSNKKDNMKNKMMKNLGGNFLLWIVIIIVSVSVLQYASLTPKSIEISYAEFTDVYKDQYENISSVIIEDKLLKGDCSPTCFGTLSNNEISSFTVILPELTNDLVNNLVDLGIDVKIKQKTLTFLDYVFQFSPWILILVFWFLIMRRMQGGVGGQNNIFSFAKSKAKIVDSKKTKKMFKDVAGCEEAKTELQEIVDFLKKSEKYHKIGAKIPKGALLLGPPGTGKTLLAKAVSGEANVPFFTISGAEFVEMFVGVGASRVRDLFSQAKTNSPSIIFIDEIDAVGRHRGAGLGGGHDEREQTLNQILVEMDGFDTNTNVILLAATNRPDVLDKALLRPGRFDRQIVVDAPDVIGREQILKIHTKKIPLTKDVKLNVVAQGTPGLVGADLENLVNEAALLAARMNQTKVSMKYFEDAKDKVMMGVERKSMVLTDDDKQITAYHEAGHALVAYFTKLADPVHKITIVPRGRAMGLTAQIPEVERYNYSNQYLLGKLDILMGGRCAEKIIFNNFTTGAGNDISVATDIAKKMVCEWGMSDTIGPMALGKKEEEVFLGKEISKSRDFSEEKLRVIDSEITSLIKNAEKNATNILKKYMKQLHNVSKVLIERETLDRTQFEDIVKNGISDDKKKEPVKRVRRKSVNK
jgi:cell division protease FtsH